ncbi:MAG TPA: KH domain-containing protein [Trueperaceae bacterium]|nr:KH domain-containing protein [Trueperaceae bacterium]
MVVDLVNYILVNLVAEPERLTVTAQRSEDAVLIEVTCAADDAGRIIGRGGRVINAVRTLARAAADGRQRVEVQLLE